MTNTIAQYRERYRAVCQMARDQHQAEAAEALLTELRAMGAALSNLDDREAVAQIARHVGALITSLTGSEVPVRLLPLDPAVHLAYREQRPSLRRDSSPDLVLRALKLGPDAIPLDRLSSHQPLPPGSYMPIKPHPLFVGRDDEIWSLARLFRAAEGGSNSRLVAITGIVGIGKSQLACEFAYRYGAFFSEGVFWLDSSDPNRLPNEIAACGGVGHLQLWQGSTSLDLEEKVALVQAVWQDDRPRLIVFDGCEDEDLLARWRPPGPGVRVLVTSRRAIWNPAFVLDEVPLNSFARTSSVALLRAFRPDVDEQDQLLDQIADQLGDLPLAINLAGSYLARYRRSLPLATYLEQIRQITQPKPSRTLDHANLPPGVRKIEQIFEISFGGLRSDEPSDALAIQILQRAAYLAPGVPIPRDLLLRAIGLNPDNMTQLLAADDAIIRLYELGLIDGDELSGVIRLHRLMVVFVLQAAPDETAHAAIWDILAEASDQAHEQVRRDLVEELYPHVRWLVDHGDNRRDAARLMNELIRQLLFLSDYRELRSYAEQALAIRREQLGADHAKTSESMYQLAFVLKGLGEHDQALDLYQSALSVFRAMADPDPKALSRTLSDIGEIYALRQEFVESQRLMEEAVAISTRAYGAEHPETARQLNSLAFALHLAGSYSEARADYERVLAIFLQAYHPDHEDIAMVYQNLGELDMQEGDLLKARARFQFALEILERALGPRHLDTAYTLHYLGLCQARLGQIAWGRGSLERALSIRRERLGDQHPDTAETAAELERLASAI